MVLWMKDEKQVFSPKTTYFIIIIIIFAHMMQAMIFAAGLGTRLKPLTDTMPKALVRVGGEPLLKHVIMNLRNEGFTRIVVNVHHFASQIVDYLNANANFGLDIAISDETGMLLDTGGGIRKAASLFSSSSPILIHNVDILSNVCLRDFYLSAANNDATLLVSERQTKRYLLFDEDLRMRGWTNIATGEIKGDIARVDNIAALRKYAFAGIHVFSPALFPLMQAYPEKFGIMDFYIQECDKARIVGHPKEGLKLMDVGKAETLSDAEAFLNSLSETKY